MRIGRLIAGATLSGTSWQLTSGPFTAADLSGITLEFADTTASGSGGVNRYTEADGTLTLFGIADQVMEFTAAT